MTAAVLGVEKQDQRREWWRRGKQHVLPQEGVERSDLFTCKVTCSLKHTHTVCKMRMTCTHTGTCLIYFSSKTGCVVWIFLPSILYFFHLFPVPKAHNFPALVEHLRTRTIPLCCTCTHTACWLVINVNTGPKSNTPRKGVTAGPSHWSNWEFWAAPEPGSWNAYGFASQHILHFCGRVESFPFFEVKWIHTKVMQCYAFPSVRIFQLVV